MRALNHLVFLLVLFSGSLRSDVRGRAEIQLALDGS